MGLDSSALYDLRHSYAYLHPAFAHFYQIDAEGHEEAVLRGMDGLLSSQEKRVKVLVVEIDQCQSPEQTPIINIMKKYGYMLKKHKTSPPGSGLIVYPVFG